MQRTRLARARCEAIELPLSVKDYPAGRAHHGPRAPRPFLFRDGAAVYHVRRVVRTCARVIERNRALIFRVPSLFVLGVVVLALGYLGEWEV